MADVTTVTIYSNTVTVSLGAGPQGPAGPGVVAGGTTGQVLAKINGTDYNTNWVNRHPMTTSGDMIYGGASGIDTRLAKGLNGEILSLVAGIPAWVSAAAATGGLEAAGPFTVVNNANSDLLGQLFSSGTYTQIDFMARIIRGTTIFARAEFSIFFRNGAWEVMLGFERGLEPSGITWSVNATTGQINAAADNGVGNATIDLKKILWFA